MPTRVPVLRIRFFRAAKGREPVRDWLKSRPAEERKAIGDDLRTMQFGWPLGMPLVRSLGSGIWEVRTRLPNRIARVLFTTFEDEAVLLHGFIKKSQETPLHELRLAKRRKRGLT
jgi:phage-related protein